VSWSFFSDGLRCEVQTGRADMLSGNFRWYAESNEFVIVGVTKKGFHVFPKGAFAANDLVAFQALLNEHVPQRK